MVFMALYADIIMTSIVMLKRSLEQNQIGVSDFRLSYGIIRLRKNMFSIN